jgi:hypothetical protein
MNYHSLSLWANPHKIVIEPQPKDCPETFVMTTDELFISYLNIPTLQVIIHSIMNKLNTSTKWFSHQTHVQKFPNVSMSSDGPLNNFLKFIWFTFSHLDWWSKDTMIIKCQHNIWKWWTKFHLNEMDLKLINVGKYWAHRFAYPPSLSNIVWCLHVLA